MSVPKQRKSVSRTKRGRSHLSVDAKNLGTCAACKAPIEPHRACASCGNYAGRTVKQA